MRADDVQVGSIVRTHGFLAHTAGLMVGKHLLEHRQPETAGRVFAFLEDDNDISVVFVRHRGKEAAYFCYELDLMADPVHDN